jgi:hypothetical protein
MKPKHKNLRAQPNASPEQPTSQPKPPVPTPEQIQQRAHEIFEARGGAPGHDLDDWLQAEAELKAEIGRPRENPAV